MFGTQLSFTAHNMLRMNLVAKSGEEKQRVGFNR